MVGTEVFVLRMNRALAGSTGCCNKITKGGLCAASRPTGRRGSSEAAVITPQSITNNFGVHLGLV